MKRSPKTPAEIAAFAIALSVSLVNILMHMFSGFHYSMIASLIGIGFAIAFLQNLKLYNTLFYVLALTQLIIIKFPVSQEKNLISARCFHWERECSLISNMVISI